MPPDTRDFMREVHGEDFEAEAIDAELHTARYRAVARKRDWYADLVKFAAPRVWAGVGVGFQVVIGLIGAAVFGLIAFFIAIAVQT